MVWQPANWEHLRKLPADLNPTDPARCRNGPPAQIDVYTGGNLRWADVTVPKGLEVIDQRLEAHGFTLADGVVLEGKVIDLATQAARRREDAAAARRTAAQGWVSLRGRDRDATADAQGHWVLKKTPAGWHRVVIEADGFVPRVAGYAQFDDQPRWHFYDCGLARPAPVVGPRHRRGGPAAGGCRGAASRRRTRAAADAMNRRTIFVQDRRRRPLPCGSGSCRTGHDLAAQARLLPPGPGPADHDAERTTSS